MSYNALDENEDRYASFDLSFVLFILIAAFGFIFG